MDRDSAIAVEHVPSEGSFSGQHSKRNNREKHFPQTEVEKKQSQVSLSQDNGSFSPSSLVNAGQSNWLNIFMRWIIRPPQCLKWEITVDKSNGNGWEKRQPGKLISYGLWLPVYLQGIWTSLLKHSLWPASNPEYTHQHTFLWIQRLICSFVWFLLQIFDNGKGSNNNRAFLTVVRYLSERV